MIFVISGCKKETGGPKINLSLKNVNGSSFTMPSNIVFNFDFTPIKTSTGSNLTFYAVRKFYTCPYVTTPDTLKQLLPEVDNTGKAQLRYEYTYSNNQGIFNAGCANAGGVIRTDSLNFWFWVKDSDGNVSDTIISPKIILVKP